MSVFFSNIFIKGKEKISAVLPKYSIFPLFLMMAVNFVTYYGSRLLASGWHHHSLKIFADDLIPLNTAFVYIYILAYVQWAVGYILIVRESRMYGLRFLTGEILAKLFCLLFFIFYPTTILRPEITGHSFADVLTRHIYMLDAPDNLFPSIHCLESYICFRGALGLKKAPGWYPAASLVFSVLVFASTVCLKQHVCADMLGAVAVSELGLFLSGLYFKNKAL